MDLFLIKLADEMQQRQWRTVFVFSAEPAREFAQSLQDRAIPYFVADFPLSLVGTFRLIRQLRAYYPLRRATDTGKGRHDVVGGLSPDPKSL